jgi:acetyl esterase/lipase
MIGKAFGSFLAVSLSTAVQSLSPAFAHPPLPAGCDAQHLPACRYLSDLDFSNVGVVTTTLTDAARGNYPVPILIRFPIGANGPRPVVIFNHGGEPRANGRNGSSEWSTAMARAGYVVIHPSRSVVESPSADQLDECADNGVIGVTACGQWLGHSKFGPMNTNFLISQFAQLEQLHAELDGLLDRRKIVVAGWSAGTTVALANAGAWRRFDPEGPVYRQASTRPIAFMAVAPFGPDYGGFYYSPTWNFGGFQSRSFDAIDERPFLFVTGKGDFGPKVIVDLSREDVRSEARSLSWLRATPGRKYLAWDLDLRASHGTMNISDCGTALKQAHCRAIQSLGIAYLDAIVRRRVEAIRWLASDAFVTLTAGAIELHRR